MLNKKFLIIVSLALFSLIIQYQSYAQTEESFRMQLESILQKFKNYRFSNISVWRLTDIKDVRKIIKLRDEAESITTTGGEVNEDCLKGQDNLVLQLIQAGVNEGKSQTAIARDFLARGIPQPPQAIYECIYNYYYLKLSGPSKQIRSVYVITTRKTSDQLVPNTIIGVIVSYDDNEFDHKKNVNNASPNNIFTYPELKEFPLDPKEFRSKNFYGLIENAFLQGTVKDITLEAQGIGSYISWFPPQVGITKSLLSQEAIVSSSEVQTFKRISEGQPVDYDSKLNEVIISPDLISWRRYDYNLYVYPDGTVDTISLVANSNLPKYGIEFKYGLEGINYPSLWSERLTVSAVWQSVKLGLILPTNGYSDISKDVFGTNRKLTFGGVGISGEADFSLPVIPKSGVFQTNFAYVFGDAKEGPVKRNLDPILYTNPNYDDNDYLVRLNGQLHYTFGVSIDDDYLLRFGLGATMYIMEKWYNNVNYDEELRENKISYEMLQDEIIGGVSGKIDFMAKNATTPYGASIQYFDEGLYTNIWLQVPIVDKTFSFRIDAKGFFKAFSNTPRRWENKSVFIPMARLIINF